MRSERCAARRVLGSPSAEDGEVSSATRSRSRSAEEPHAKTNVRETVGALRFLVPSGPLKPTNVRKTDPLFNRLSGRGVRWRGGAVMAVARRRGGAVARWRGGAVAR